MKPWQGLLLAGGALAAAATAAVVSKKPQPTVIVHGPTPTPPPQTLTLAAGERYTFTVVSSSPLAVDPSLATLNLPAALTPVSVTTQNSTHVSVVADATSAGSVLASDVATGVGAPAGSVVSMVDSGPTLAALQTIPGAKPPAIPDIIIGASDAGSTKSLTIGQRAEITLPFTLGALWTWAFNGTSVVSTGAQSTISGLTQMDTFKAVAAGDTILTATNPSGGTFTIKLAVS